MISVAFQNIVKKRTTLLILAGHSEEFGQFFSMYPLPFGKKVKESVVVTARNSAYVQLFMFHSLNPSGTNRGLESSPFPLRV
jgi:hypothetical protein